MDQGSKEQYKAIATTTGSRKLADFDPVGLPDDEDIRNIKTIMRNYERAMPGEIADSIRAARASQEAAFNELASNKAKDFRHALTMPVGLLRMIEESYPLMFTNRKHLHWFLKTFPQFRVARKI